MPLFGAHMSVAGGLHLAFERIVSVGGEALQIFTRNQRQWEAAPVSEEEVERFRSAWEASGGMPVASHDSYLINLASGDAAAAERSVAAFVGELRRCRALGIPYVVAHPGAHGGRGIDAGIRGFVANLDRAIETAEAEGVKVLIETTAGQGTGLGADFEEIARILESTRFPERLGVCLDTCHLFAAGHDIATAEGYETMMARLEELIGVEAVRWCHLNDSKNPLGSRVDRHEHIGDGTIGLEGFRLLVNDPRFRELPMILETPKGKDLKEDRENLRRLRSLVGP